MLPRITHLIKEEPASKKRSTLDGVQGSSPSPSPPTRDDGMDALRQKKLDLRPCLDSGTKMSPSQEEKEEEEEEEEEPIVVLTEEEFKKKQAEKEDDEFLLSFWGPIETDEVFNNKPKDDNKEEEEFVLSIWEPIKTEEDEEVNTKLS